LWFNEGDKNLLVIHDEKGIVFFEYINDKKVLEGGRNSPYRFGYIEESRVDAREVRKARTKKYHSDRPPDFCKEAEEQIQNCHEMPVYVHKALLRFLNKDRHHLEFDTPISDYKTLRNSTQIIKIMTPLFRFQIFQYWGGWFVPAIIGLLLLIFGSLFIVTKFDRRDEIGFNCRKSGQKEDCLHFVKNLIDGTLKQFDPQYAEPAFKVVVEQCAYNQKTADACDLLRNAVENLRVKPNLDYGISLDELLSMLSGKCRLLDDKKIFSGTCEVLGHLREQEWGKPTKNPRLVLGFDETVAQRFFECLFIADTIKEKLQVESLPLNLFFKLKTCHERLEPFYPALDPKMEIVTSNLNKKSIAADGPRSFVKLCHEFNLCLPSYAWNLRNGKIKESSKISDPFFFLLSRECKSYGDGACWVTACLKGNELTKEDIQSLTNQNHYAIWKSREGLGLGVPTMLQFFSHFTDSEKNWYSKYWSNRCDKNDIRSCVAKVLTSPREDFKQNFAPICRAIRHQLKHAPIEQLLLPAWDLKFPGEY